MRFVYGKWLEVDGSFNGRMEWIFFFKRVINLNAVFQNRMFSYRKWRFGKSIFVFSLKRTNFLGKLFDPKV